MSKRDKLIEDLQRLAAAEKAAVVTQTLETTMKDDPTKTALDRSLISLQQEHEVRYWTDVLGCTEEELRRAVAHVGDSAQDVRDYLGR